MSIKIIGAGMAGLLAANLLRRHKPVVIEQQAVLPHNHTALLRFRSPAVSDATGIPFRRVTVRKAIWDGEQLVTECNVKLANIYAQAAMPGHCESRSIWNMAPEDRWIAPGNFVEQMADQVDVRYNTTILLDVCPKELPIISTLPMPLANKQLQGPIALRFDHFGIYTTTIRIERPQLAVYQTVYNSARGVGAGHWYRASLHGDTLIVESSIQYIQLPEIQNILERAFGLSCDWLAEPLFGSSPFGKILPIQEEARCSFISWATDTHNLYSLGRFATWRPGLLLDDIVSDVKVIERLIQSGPYQRKLQSTKP